MPSVGISNIGLAYAVRFLSAPVLESDARAGTLRRLGHWREYSTEPACAAMLPSPLRYHVFETIPVVGFRAGGLEGEVHERGRLGLRAFQRRHAGSEVRLDVLQWRERITKNSSPVRAAQGYHS